MEWLIGVLPIALVALTCPLMMILMMLRMHGGHASPSGRDSSDDRIAELKQQVRELRDECDRDDKAA
jgi:hypothetical protein